jgi:mono/diheme cytochrome c family protein
MSSAFITFERAKMNKLTGHDCRLFAATAVLIVVSLAHVQIQAQTKRSWTAPPEAKSAKNPVASSDAALDQGKKLFREYCVDCHGAKGDGKGAMAGSLKRQPADLSGAQTPGLTDGEIFWRISKGDDIMPSFEKTFPLSVDQRWQLVHFVRSLSKKSKVRQPSWKKRDFASRSIKSAASALAPALTSLPAFFLLTMKEKLERRMKATFRRNDSSMRRKGVRPWRS